MGTHLHTFEDLVVILECLGSYWALYLMIDSFALPNIHFPNA